MEDLSQFVAENPDVVAIALPDKPHIQKLKVSCSQCGHLIRRGGNAPKTRLVHIACNHCSVQGTLVFASDCRHVLGYIGDFDFDLI